MSMLKEFQEFALKGNVMDMAIGVIIGAAFGGVVSSLVNDVLMPPLGQLAGKVDFSNLYLNLSGTAYPTLAAAEEAGAAVMKYGVFLNNVINFAILAFVVFLLVKQINRLRKVDPPPPPDSKECTYCKSDVPIAATRCKFCTSELATA